MRETDLLFQQPATLNTDLVFGADEGGGAGDYSVSIAARLPALRMQATVVPVARVSLQARLPGLRMATVAVYDVRVQRPTVGEVQSDWQEASPAEAGVAVPHQVSARQPAATLARWQVAANVAADVRGVAARQLARSRLDIEAPHSNAVRLSTHPIRDRFADMIHLPRPQLSARHQNAARLHPPTVASGWSEMLHDRRPDVATRWQSASPLRRALAARAGRPQPLVIAMRGRYQDAMRPPAGTSHEPVVPPPAPPCYTPNPHLVFKNGPGGPHLVFVCERDPDIPSGTVVVPVREVYMIVNEVTLRRVVGDIELPASSVSLQLDADSWTWGFTASLPGDALEYIEPIGGEPTELELSLNGKPYRVLVEGISRERQFPTSTIRITGRGRNAALDAPYAPVLTFGNAAARTAQQLMHDVLTVNGASLGWSLDWQLDDWLVPAGAWSHQGSYISALNAIAGAAGGYIQPHATADTLRVLHRYPAAPWDWVKLEPDFELPSAVTQREAIEWKSLPDYNGVYVSGVSAGVLGFVRRNGTPGDRLAPMVTDALITDAVAARQRGRATLSLTGRQALVTLRLPVLSETGAIWPGRMVRYVDAGERHIGIVRSTSVEGALPELWQTIGVETYVV